MNPEEALQILRNVANFAVTKGGIYNNVNEVATVSHALKVLNMTIESKTSEVGQTSENKER